MASEFIPENNDAITASTTDFLLHLGQQCNGLLHVVAWHLL